MPQSDEHPTAYEIYFAERAELVRGSTSGSHAFDKTLTTLAAGAIAFSLTYVQVFIAKLEDASAPVLLYLAWGLFLLALVVILTSFLTSQRAYARQIQIVEEGFLSDREQEDEDEVASKNCWSTATQALNFGSLVAFVAGVVALSVFALLNIP